MNSLEESQLLAKCVNIILTERLLDVDRTISAQTLSFFRSALANYLLGKLELSNEDILKLKSIKGDFSAAFSSNVGNSFEFNKDGAEGEMILRFIEGKNPKNYASFVSGRVGTIKVNALKFLSIAQSQGIDKAFEDLGLTIEHELRHAMQYWDPEHETFKKPIRGLPPAKVIRSKKNIKPGFDWRAGESLEDTEFQTYLGDLWSDIGASLDIIDKSFENNKEIKSIFIKLIVLGAPRNLWKNYTRNIENGDQIDKLLDNIADRHSFMFHLKEHDPERWKAAATRIVQLYNKKS